MLYKYYCGLLFGSNSINYIKLIKSDQSYTELDSDHKCLLIYFKEGDTSDSITNSMVSLSETLPLEEAEFELIPSMKFDGIELISCYPYEVKTVEQFLIEDQVLDKPGVYHQGDQLAIVITKSLLDKLDIDSYVNFINSYGFVYARKVGDLSISNHQLMEFNDRSYVSRDSYIYGTEETYAVDAPIYVSHLIRAIKSKFPNLDVFVSDGDRNTSKSEWLQLKMTLDSVNDGFHTIVHESHTYGRWTNSNIKINLEYTTNDLNLALTRRNQYLHGQFLNEIRTIKFPVGESTFACSIFWDRDSITSDKLEESTSMDSTGYRLFSFDIQATIYMSVSEFVDKKYPKILKTILKLINTSDELDDDRGI